MIPPHSNDPLQERLPNIEHFHRVSEIAYKAASGWKKGEERTGLQFSPLLRSLFDAFEVRSGMTA